MSVEQIRPFASPAARGMCWAREPPAGVRFFCAGHGEAPERTSCVPLQVGNLAGYVSDNAAYHHGEASLAQTIVGMAQDFVGSNNINLLYPGGMFGTRRQVRSGILRKAP